MLEMYRNAVTSIGAEADIFLETGMLVTFGDQAPAELKEFCYLLGEAAPTVGTINADCVLAIDGNPFPVTAVGSAAQRNLDALGHVTVKFDGSSLPALAGTIHVEAEYGMPKIVIGSVLSIRG